MSAHPLAYVRVFRSMAAHGASIALADLINENLQAVVTPQDVKKFVLEHWETISPLAHAIHRERAEDTAQPMSPE